MSNQERDEKVVELAKRYKAAAHAVQTGVKIDQETLHSEDGTPKHLRTGLNMVMRDHASLAELLIRKGVITELEYLEAITEGTEEEARQYEERLSEELGSNIHLS